MDWILLRSLVQLEHLAVLINLILTTMGMMIMMMVTMMMMPTIMIS